MICLSGNSDRFIVRSFSRADSHHFGGVAGGNVNDEQQPDQQLQFYRRMARAMGMRIVTVVPSSLSIRGNGISPQDEYTQPNQSQH